ncbi:mucin-17 [Capsicum chacoense]
MTSSGKEDQDQSKINGIEDSKTTIEFLRGRLLAERSASRTAKQRADELAQRVSELEEQLKVVSLQRKKAEKATAAVLSILENHAVDDVSEEFSSGSDQETILSDSKDAQNKKEGGEISSSAKEKEDDVDTFSSSGIASSPSTARSLSWKSGKSSSHSLERRKYTDSNRRRSSNFSSTDISSSKRGGKSCRRIRRRDTRSASDKLQNSSAECASEALPSSANNEQQSLTAEAGNSDANDQVHVSASGVSENGRQADKSDENRQRALHQQAQVTRQYEAEEKAQREWEEKYRESNSCTRDSCDPENYWDVTEERDDLKASQKPYSAQRSGMQNHVNKYGSADVPSTGENGTINCFPSTPHVNVGCLKDTQANRTVESDSPTLKGSRLMSNGNYLENHGQTSAYGHQHSVPVTHSPMHPQVHTTSSSGGSSLQAGQALQTGYELALVTHNSSNGLGSVLGELKQAKLSLSKQINSSPPTITGSSIKAMEYPILATKIGDRSGTPAGYSTPFSQPTDFQLEATTTASYPVLPSRFSSTSYYPAPSTYEISASPYVESRSNYVTRSNRFTSPTPRAFAEVSSSTPSYRRVSETNLDAAPPSSMRFNPHSSSRLPFSSKFAYPSYPMIPDVVPKLPSGELFSRNFPTNETSPPSFSFSTFRPEVVPRLPSSEVFSRNFPMNETSMPPSFSASGYVPHIRPNMYSS